MALSESPRLGFDPFAELRRMQSETNRAFSGLNATAARDFPPINIWLGEHSVVLTAELPGITRGDANLSLQEGVLTLAGKREPKSQEQNVNWQRRERAYGTFSRAVQLPFRVDPDISLERRVLTIRGRTVANEHGGYQRVYNEYTDGDYERVFTLSENIDRNRIEATLKDGILQLVLPKAEAAKARKIELKAS